ncbi:MAG: DUF2177 family protein [Pyrinomonadaceae bacterium]|nr:DUF2177 family protein [Pyrinomonadaceae bacterium]
MSITNFIKIYLITLPVFFAIDMIWLGLIARNFYQAQIGHLLRPSVNWTAAIIFYLMFIAGMIIFVISPALEKSSWTYALIYGALFGLLTYATYDLTNLATLKDFPVTVAVVDMIWGTVLSASVCTISYFLSSKFAV